MSQGPGTPSVSLVDAVTGSPIASESRDGSRVYEVTIPEERRVLEELLLALRSVTDRLLISDATGGVIIDASATTVGQGQAPWTVINPDVFIGPISLDSLGEALTVRLQGHTNVTFNVTAATGAHTLIFETSSDSGITWVQVPCMFYLAGTAFSTTQVIDTSLGQFSVITAGYNAVRCRISAYTSGALTVMARATYGIQQVTLAAGGALIGQVAQNAGTPTPNTVAWSVNAGLTSTKNLAGSGGVGGGQYACALASGALVPGGTSAIRVFDFRYGTAGLVAVVTNVRITCFTAVLGAAGSITCAVLPVRSFTANDTNGTAATLTGNNTKKRTSYGTTGAADIRISSTVALSGGTLTADAQAVAQGGYWSSAAGSGGEIAAYNTNVLDGPLVLVQNEGLIVQLTVPHASTQVQLYVQIHWMETATWPV